MSARDPMTELAVTMESLIDAVKILSAKLDKLQDEKVSNLSERLAIAENDVGRLQKVVYGCLAAVGLQALVVFSGLVVWLIHK